MIEYNSIINLLLTAENETKDTVFYDYQWWEIVIILFIVVLPWLALVVYSFIKKFRITFITGCDIEVPSQYYKGKKPISLPKPIRKGYEFKGWYIDKDLEELFEEEVMPGQNIKLYAKWEEKNK